MHLTSSQHRTIWAFITAISTLLAYCIISDTIDGNIMPAKHFVMACILLPMYAAHNWGVWQNTVAEERA